MTTFQKQLAVPAIKMLLDLLTIEAAVLAAYYMRFYSPFTLVFPVSKGVPALGQYLGFSVFLMAVFITLFGIFNAYRSRFFSTFYQDIPVIFKTCFLGTLLAMSAAFLYRDISYSRMVFILIFLLSNLFLRFSRYFFHRIKKRFIKVGFGVMRIWLAGTPDNITGIFRQLAADENYRFQIAGYFSPAASGDLPAPYLGDMAMLLEGLSAGKEIDGIVMAFNQQEHHQVLKVMRACEGRNIELFYVPDILSILSSRFQAIEIRGVPLLQLKQTLLSGWRGFIKRTFDVVVSFISLLLLLPLFAVLAMLVKAASRGPVFYIQERVGLDGREFKMLKFRSMRLDAEVGSGPVWARKGDPRVTWIGRFLRRSSLDELPQLLNVLRGDMSLVGPRPERRHFVEQFQQHIPKYIERHRVRSGMTGWAQVNGLRGQSPIEERTRYDIFYIENWSLWFDLKIIIMTFIEVVRGKNAY